MSHFYRHILILVLFTGFVQSVFAQNQFISYQAENVSLKTVLEDISKKYNLHFAYDPDQLQHINTSLNLKQSNTKQFLKILETDYSVSSTLIDGTWILVYHEPEVQLTATEDKIHKWKTISGYVKDAVTGDDLLYCNVSSGQDKGSMTNHLGFFNFEIENKDSVLISVSHLGYHSLDTLILGNEYVEILLEPLEYFIKAINVTHFEKDVLQASPQPDKIGFNPVKSTNIPRISNDDLANALLIIPGVNFFQGGSAGISIRGSSPTDNLVLLDGIPVLETNHLLGNMSVLNSKFVQQAFISRGGFDAEYGGRVAGIIELKGKSGKNRNPYLDFSANLLNSNLLVNLPVTDKFSITAAWRRSFIDQWQNYMYMRLIEGVSSNNLNDNVITSSIYPTISYQDINTKVSFHPADNLEVNLNFLYGDDHQDRDFELYNTKDYYRNELVESKTKGFSFNLNWQMNKSWYHSLSGGYSNLKKIITDETGELEEVTEIIENPGQGSGKGGGKGLVKNREKTYTRFNYDTDNGNNNVDDYRIEWKSTFEKSIFKNQAGFGWNANSFSYNFFANRTYSEFPIDSIARNDDQYLLSAFVQQKIQFNPKLSLKWGVRLNSDLYTLKNYWDPRGGMEYQPFKGLCLNVSGGVYHQFLSSVKRIDREGHFNQVWFLPGSEGGGVVKSFHQTIGLKYDKDGWFINAEGYVKNTKGKMNFFANQIMKENEPVIVYSPKESDEKYRGVDFFLQKKHGIFNHMVGYSVSKSKERIQDIFGEIWIPGYNDRRHRLKLTEMVSIKNWTVTASWNYGSGLPVINLTDDNFITGNNRTEYFSQLDLAIVKKIRLKGSIINAGVSLLNLINRENIVEVDFLHFTSDTESLTVRSDISALAFTPVFFVNYNLH